MYFRVFVVLNRVSQGSLKSAFRLLSSGRLCPMKGLDCLCPLNHTIFCLLVRKEDISTLVTLRKWVEIFVKCCWSIPRQKTEIGKYLSKSSKVSLETHYCFVSRL